MIHLTTDKGRLLHTFFSHFFHNLKLSLWNFIYLGVQEREWVRISRNLLKTILLMNVKTINRITWRIFFLLLYLCFYVSMQCSVLCVFFSIFLLCFIRHTCCECVITDNYIILELFFGVHLTGTQSFRRKISACIFFIWFFFLVNHKGLTSSIILTHHTKKEKSQ